MSILTAAEFRQIVTKDLAANSPVVFVLPDGRRLTITERNIIPLVEEVDGKKKFAGPPTLVICLKPEEPIPRVAGTRMKGSGA
jgi:hypothetical protein